MRLAGSPTDMSEKVIAELRNPCSRYTLGAASRAAGSEGSRFFLASGCVRFCDRTHSCCHGGQSADPGEATMNIAHPLAFPSLRGAAIIRANCGVCNQENFTYGQLPDRAGVWQGPAQAVSSGRSRCFSGVPIATACSKPTTRAGSRCRCCSR